MGGAPTFCSRVISWHWLMGEIQGVSREHINRAEPASCTRAPLGQSRLRYIKAKKKKKTHNSVGLFAEISQPGPTEGTSCNKTRTVRFHKASASLAFIYTQKRYSLQCDIPPRITLFILWRIPNAYL